MRKSYKQWILGVSLGMICGVASSADVVKIGMLQGFTGPTESLVAPMAMGGELAIKEVSDSGLFLGGKQVVSVRGDSTCIDAAAATAAEGAGLSSGAGGCAFFLAGRAAAGLGLRSTEGEIAPAISADSDRLTASRSRSSRRASRS